MLLGHSVSRSAGGPGLGGVHGNGAVALPRIRPSTPTPLVIPVVPGRGPWPANQGFRRRVAGAQVDGTESGVNFGVWECGCACGLIRP